MCGERDCSRCVCSSPQCHGNPQEASEEAKQRKIPAAPQGCASFYQEGSLQHPNPSKVLAAADFGCCLILFLVSNSQKCNQNHAQARSPGGFAPDLLPGSLFQPNPQAGAKISLGFALALPWLEAPPVPCPKLLQKRAGGLLPEMDTFVQHCCCLTVKYLPLPLFRAFLKALSFTENAQELRD